MYQNISLLLCCYDIYLIHLLCILMCGRRFHNVMTEDAIGRVWVCMENAIALMEAEYNMDDAGT